MKTFWTSKGEPINLGNPRDVSVATMIQYEKLEKEGRQLEGALLLVKDLLEFKEDMEIINNMSVEDLASLMNDWMKTDED